MTRHVGLRQDSSRLVLASRFNGQSVGVLRFDSEATECCVVAGFGVAWRGGVRLGGAPLGLAYLVKSRFLHWLAHLGSAPGQWNAESRQVRLWLGNACLDGSCLVQAGHGMMGQLKEFS